MRALFCTDGSKISYNAVKNFGEWACKDMVVDIICVIDWSFLPDDTVIEDSGFITGCRDIADDILEYSEQVVKDAGLIAGEKIKLCGSAVESIIEQINEREYDMVLIGSHGKKGFQMWLGSVSREVLVVSKIPAYISKEKRISKKLLFATDGSETSEKLINFVIKLLNLNDKELYLCTVVETPSLLFLEGTLDANWLLSIEEQQMKSAEKSLKAFEDILHDKNLTIKKSSVLSGNPTQNILDFAKKHDIDLIVTGSKSKTKMQTFLLDSVSKRVVENTKCDTLIVKFDNEK